MGGNNEKKIKQQRITKCFPRWNSNRYRHQRKDGKQHWEIPPLVGRGDMLTAEKRHSVDSWVGSDMLQRRIAFKILPSLALPPPPQPPFNYPARKMLRLEPVSLNPSFIRQATCVHHSSYSINDKHQRAIDSRCRRKEITNEIRNPILDSRRFKWAVCSPVAPANHQLPRRRQKYSAALNGNPSNLIPECGTRPNPARSNINTIFGRKTLSGGRNKAGKQSSSSSSSSSSNSQQWTRHFSFFFFSLKMIQNVGSIENQSIRPQMHDQDGCPFSKPGMEMFELTASQWLRPGGEIRETPVGKQQKCHGARSQWAHPQMSIFKCQEIFQSEAKESIELSVKTHTHTHTHTHTSARADAT